MLGVVRSRGRAAGARGRWGGWGRDALLVSVGVDTLLDSRAHATRELLSNALESSRGLLDGGSGQRVRSRLLLDQVGVDGATLASGDDLRLDANQGLDGALERALQLGHGLGNVGRANNVNLSAALNGGGALLDISEELVGGRGQRARVAAEAGDRSLKSRNILGDGIEDALDNGNLRNCGTHEGQNLEKSHICGGISIW